MHKLANNFNAREKMGPHDIYDIAILKSRVVVRSHSPKNLIHLFFSHMYQVMGVVVAGGHGTKSELIVRE